MPRRLKPLTVKEIESAIQQARKARKLRWLSDGNGLALAVTATGYATYYLRYRHPDTREEKSHRLGAHTSEFGLAEARLEAAAARELLRRGLDPAQQVKQQAQARVPAQCDH